jgi:hypothetical protein
MTYIGMAPLTALAQGGTWSCTRTGQWVLAWTAPVPAGTYNWNLAIAGNTGGTNGAVATLVATLNSVGGDAWCRNAGNYWQGHLVAGCTVTANLGGNAFTAYFIPTQAEPK